MVTERVVDADPSENARLVRRLCALWEEPGYSADALIPFFAPDCAVRLMHSLPFARGPAAVVEQARSLMPLGTERIRVRHLALQLAGPMVIAHRIDTFIVPGQPDSDWEMFGVFLIADGRIKEWTDYMFGQAAAAVAEDGRA